MFLALDPGPEKTGWVRYDGERVLSAATLLNDELVRRLYLMGKMFRLSQLSPSDTLAIEMIDSYGMPVGKDVFRTLMWIGRFVQAWPRPDEVILIERRVIKLELCGSSRAKDSNVRAALIDRLGPPGTKKNPGATYGCAGHIWAALAVAVVAAGFSADKNRQTKNGRETRPHS